MQIIGWYRAKAISDNVTKKTKAIKGSIIFSMKLTNMTKLKSLIKLNNPPVALIGYSLGIKPPQTDPQIHLYELKKQC